MFTPSVSNFRPLVFSGRKPSRNYNRGSDSFLSSNRIVSSSRASTWGRFGRFLKREFTRKINPETVQRVESHFGINIDPSQTFKNYSRSSAGITVLSLGSVWLPVGAYAGTNHLIRRHQFKKGLIKYSAAIQLIRQNYVLKSQAIKDLKKINENTYPDKNSFYRVAFQFNGDRHRVYVLMTRDCDVAERLRTEAQQNDGLLPPYFSFH
jgi:hypothetical protein